MTTPRIVFLDTETTGLDSERHEVWEFGWITRYENSRQIEYLYRIKPDLTVADPTGLRISRYYERTDAMLGIGEAGVSPLFNLADAGQQAPRWSDPAEVADFLAHQIDGAHLVGAVPSFDAAFISRFLRSHGQAPTHHYHLIDVETLAVGHLHGQGRGGVVGSLPWRSDDLSRAVGVEPPGPDERHTALGDARWARDLFDAVTKADQ